MTNPTGEAETGLLRPDFDRRVAIHFRGSVVTSDAGLLAYRELDDVLGSSVVGGKATKGRAASPSQMGRFETNWLARSENLAALTDLSGLWIDRVAKDRSDDRIVLDMDSSVSPTHREQENSVWNGHFGCTCYHPLFVFKPAWRSCFDGRSWGSGRDETNRQVLCALRRWASE